MAGYAESGNRRRGLGCNFARTLHQNFRAIFRDFGEETITRSPHVEKLCLISNGVGRDTISDFTTNLILVFLADFTQAFAIEHVSPEMRAAVAIDRAGFKYETTSWVSRT